LAKINLSLTKAWVLQIYPNNIPAMVAVSSAAQVPPISALIPKAAKVLRCPGARTPIPPICIPIEAKFANPQRA
jgi:hypothetical protein